MDFERFCDLRPYGDRAALAGRILFAVAFLGFGYEKLVMFGLGGTAAYMAKQGLPFPYLFAVVATVVEIGAALLLLVGYRTRCVALGFAIYVIVATLIGHHDISVFQNFSDFLKNLAIAGGLLAFVAYGAGAYSIDGRRR